jgi:hypothetical protein
MTALAVAIAGCNSGRPTRSERYAAETKAPERPVAMKGEANFFDGQVGATITVSRGFGRNVGERGGRHGPYGEEPSLTDVFSTELNDPDNKDYAETYEKMRALQLRGSPLPPVTLRLKLNNRGADATEIEILDLNSELGNFAVRPAKLAVPAGQSGDVEPMNSQLGVTSDEIPVKVRLRRGGKVETQTVLVKSLFTGEGKKAQAAEKK